MKVNQKRALVIEMGVNLEEVASCIIAKVLGLNINDSKAFGNKSGAISFSQKIMFLIDLEHFPENTTPRHLKTFMEIRNKFAHVREVVDFSSCEPFAKEALKYLRNLCSQKVNESKEVYLTRCFNKLYAELNGLVKQMVIVIMTNNHFKYEENLEILKLYHLINSIQAAVEQDSENELSHKINDYFNVVNCSFKSTPDHLIYPPNNGYSEIFELPFFTNS